MSLSDLYRKPDCDIRIQLPEVSKEHCRIDLNENKEVMTCAEHHHVLTQSILPFKIICKMRNLFECSC